MYFNVHAEPVHFFCSLQITASTAVPCILPQSEELRKGKRSPRDRVQEIPSRRSLAQRARRYLEMKNELIALAEPNLHLDPNFNARSHAQRLRRKLEYARRYVEDSLALHVTAASPSSQLSDLLCTDFFHHHRKQSSVPNGF